MILPEILREDFMDEVVRIVLIHLNFFEDDSPHAASILDGEDWVQHQIAQDIYRNRQVFVENLNVEADALLCRERIHVAADGVNLARDLFCCTIPSPFKNHVLNEMRNTIPLRILIARTGLNPYSDRSRADMLHLLGDHRQPVRQDFTTNVSKLFNHGLPKALRQKRSVGTALLFSHTRRAAWMQSSGIEINNLAKIRKNHSNTSPRNATHQDGLKSYGVL